ncbi:hypothetical protein LEP1GSC059_1041 [Leptospira noguchii serovar Panama str. CZ214]|uniref:Uncharacterized protein n=1 Tax=Leptospira noguchii serovar Panama str. CZ214 TaxID=1001595 RepID=T0FNX3_9LEPT|nr:hypothetical protein LEP1GSC059_1041 [Leptospira noguchii serovar Panama str. CZ214]
MISRDSPGHKIILFAIKIFLKLIVGTYTGFVFYFQNVGTNTKLYLTVKS